MGPCLGRDALAQRNSCNLFPTPQRAHASLLLTLLQWGDLRRAPKPGPGQQPDVLLTLRASTGAMRSAQYQEEIINQVGGHLARLGSFQLAP